MDTRHYVIEAFAGPNEAGEFSITAKDVLKLADADRAQAPVLNTGVLNAGITNIATSATLSPVGIGNAEYAASGYLAIGGNEAVSFTRSGDVLTITRGLLGTSNVAHNAGDRVQTILQYSGQDPANIINDLFQTYANVSGSLIPLSDWQAETANYLNRLYTAYIAEPTSVNQLVSELIEQAGLVIWWDDLSETLKLQVIRRVIASDMFDGDDVLEGSLQATDQPETRVSRVWTYFNQRNPLLNLDQLENFASSVQTFDSDSETNFGSQAIKKIFSRWIPTGGSATAQRVNDLIISRYKTPPRRFNFNIASTHGPSKPQLAGGYSLQSWGLQDDVGDLETVPIQITRLELLPDRYEIEAEEMLAGDISTGNSPDSSRLINFDASANNINLRTIHDTLYATPVAGNVVRAIIAAGVIIGSNSTGSPAFDIGSWPAGVSITLEVNGRIEGAGGNGGNGGFPGNGTAGSVGGTALYLRYAINVVYGASAQLWGGGGGGGGGGSSGFGGVISGGGGGGGAGQVAGTHGTATPPTGSDGTDGTATTGGAGGSDALHPYSVGGAGGNPGQTGTNGSAGNGGFAGGSGAAAGAAIDGVSFRTVTSGSADIQGSQIN